MEASIGTAILFSLVNSGFGNNFSLERNKWILLIYEGIGDENIG